MADQFPNFLSAQLIKPDYSGIGDAVENFYKGYEMPNDALIKKIQAQFAQPNAEESLKSSKLANQIKQVEAQYAQPNAVQSLLSSRLGNRKAQLDIDKLAMEVNQQRELERQLRIALGGGSPSPTQNNMPVAVPSAPSAISIPRVPTAPQQMQVPVNNVPQANMPQAENVPAIPPELLRRLTPIGAPAPMAMPTLGNALSGGNEMQGGQSATNAPAAPIPESTVSQAEPLNEVVITKGAPQLAGIDAMYDSNPLSRQFLEKKGFKKTQEVKFDNKTGRTSIVTKYPSGKVTIQHGEGAPPSAEGVPLTNKMVSKHQNIISSIDNALPIIKKILEEGTDENTGANKTIWEPYPRSSGYIPGLGWVPGWQSQSTKYEALVNSALDSLIGAYGLPMTNEGIETVKKQLLIGHGETDKAYKKRLKELVKDLERRKSYSAVEVKKSNKISPVDTSNTGTTEATFSSNDWEEV